MPNNRLALQTGYVKEAKKALREFFRWRNAPFHFRQLEVLFETQFYHIATAQAIYQLINEGFLQAQAPIQAGGNQITFVVPGRVLSSQKNERILQAHMEAKAKVVALYDSAEVSKDLGDHFEALVRHELRANQLQIVATHANAYKGRQWHKSKANLDFIADYPDGQAFGIQAKNELKHIELDELLEQLDICACLRIKPVFIVRYMPWSFIPYVTNKHGFAATLGTQLYPIGYKKICEQIQDKLSIPENKVSRKLREIAPKMRTKWPIEVSTELPRDASSRLSHWFKTGKLPPASVPSRTMAYELVTWVEERLHMFIGRRLQQAFGEEETKWWHQGVPQPIRKKCADRREEDPNRRPLYNYTDLIDLKDIMDKNWRHFENDFRKVKGQVMSKKEFLDGLVRLNEIRKSVMHPVRGVLTEADLAFAHQMREVVESVTPSG